MSLQSACAYVDRADDDLAVSAQQGDHLAQQALIERYRRFVRAKGRSYFLVGGDSDDVEQEALIGLYKAIRDYRVDRQASFRGFAELCITRQIITAVKTATRQKHQPLNQYVSISGVRGGDDVGERHVEELLDQHHVADPVEQLVAGERLATIRRAMATMLSGLEVDVLRLYIDGRTYQEIGEQLDRQVKSIDNALQRVKRKVEQYLVAETALDRAVLAAG